MAPPKKRLRRLSHSLRSILDRRSNWCNYEDILGSSHRNGHDQVASDPESYVEPPSPPAAATAQSKEDEMMMRLAVLEERSTEIQGRVEEMQRVLYEAVEGSSSITSNIVEVLHQNTRQLMVQMSTAGIHQDGLARSIRDVVSLVNTLTPVVKALTNAVLQEGMPMTEEDRRDLGGAELLDPLQSSGSVIPKVEPAVPSTPEPAAATGITYLLVVKSDSIQALKEAGYAEITDSDDQPSYYHTAWDMEKLQHVQKDSPLRPEDLEMMFAQPAEDFHAILDPEVTERNTKSRITRNLLEYVLRLEHNLPTRKTLRMHTKHVPGVLRLYMNARWAISLAVATRLKITPAQATKIVRNVDDMQRLIRR